ncbi:hypothetical protein LTS07_006868 [Exophiala sideris]|nr:hypothetical protein LTS07_006868 [Exophiala sideris]
MNKSDVDIIVRGEDVESSGDSQKQSLEIKQEGDIAASVPQEKQATAHNAGIPNGGLQAWLQVLGAFFLWFNTCPSTLLTSFTINPPQTLRGSVLFNHVFSFLLVH